MNALRALLLVSLLSVVTVSCGGGSKSDDPVALCKQGCSKGISLCFADAGAAGDAVLALCQSTCTSSATGSDGKPCTNSSAIAAAAKVCLSKTTCDEYMACGEKLPACEGGGTTGSGGASGTGTGGRSGSGGGSGTASGGASGTGTGGATATGSCATLQTCCGQIADSTQAAQCQAAAAGSAPTTCDTILAAIRAQGACL